MKKNTQELFNEIINSDSPEKYFAKNKNELRGMSLSLFLQSMLEKYGLKKSEVLRKAGQDGSNYGYEIFRNDDKVPSRDWLLSLCIAFPFSIEETQYALRCAGLSELYPRDKRDTYIIYALNNGMSVEDINEILEMHALKTIG